MGEGESSGRARDVEAAVGWAAARVKRTVFQ